jgi:hypothetical protein
VCAHAVGVDTLIALTVYRGAFRPKPAAQDEFPSWGELADEITAMVGELTGAPPDATHADQKEQLLAIGPYALSAPHRKNENVLHVSFLVIDVDHGDPLSVVAHLTELGVAALVYASPSDTPEDRRFRVLAPVSRPIEPEKCRETRLAFAELLGLGPGSGVEGAIDASKLFFVGRLHDTPERDVWRIEGAELDVDALGEPALEWKPPAPTAALVPLAELPPANAGIVAALGSYLLHQGRVFHMCGGVGGLMRKMGFTREQCDATLREWLPDTPGAHSRIQWALQAWNHPADAVSGVDALAQYIGDEHARLVSDAMVAAKFPARAERKALREAERAARTEMVDTGETDDMAAADPEERAAGVSLALDTDKQGKPLETPVNYARVLESVFGERIRYEEFRGRVVCADIDESLGRFPDGEWSDAHTTAFMVACNGLRLNPSASVADRVIEMHARLHTFNAAQDWFMASALAWDGVPRVDRALVSYWGAEDTEATRVTSRVWLLSLAARALEPGCEVQTCPILIGAQGVRKSRSLRALVGREWFADSPLPIGDKDALQNIRGKLLWEFAENASISRKEVNAVKQFVSAPVDTFRESYARHAVDVARTVTFVATSNDDEGILRDPTGARRWFPVFVNHADVPAIIRDREQLLGEAAARVLGGEPWWPEHAEEAALADIRAEVGESDTWDDVLAEWLQRRHPAVEGVAFVLGEEAPFAIGEVFDEVHGAFPMPADRVGRSEQVRAGNALRRLGWRAVRVKARANGGRDRRMWVRA